MLTQERQAEAREALEKAMFDYITALGLDADAFNYSEFNQMLEEAEESINQNAFDPYRD